MKFVRRDKPKLIIVIGVSGSGKSTIAEQLASRLEYKYLDADDFHSQEAKAQMAAGIPLSDELRSPWIERILNFLYKNQESNVLAFSGLRKKHRQAFRENHLETIFLHLVLSTDSIKKRMEKRTNHFFPQELLQSQLDDFESTDGELNIYPIDAEQSIDRCVENSIDILKKLTRKNATIENGN